MRNNWMFLMDFDGGSRHFLPADPLIANGLGIHLLSQITSFLDSSLYQSGNMHGSVALREAFSYFSKFAGGLIFWFSTGSNSRSRHKLTGGTADSGNCRSSSRLKHSVRQDVSGFVHNLKLKSLSPFVFSKSLGSIFSDLLRDTNQLQSLPILSLAAALVPPFENLTSLAIPLENTHVNQMRGYMELPPGEIQRQGCGGLCFSDVYRKRYAVEPKTGIEFPVFLDNISSGTNSATVASEVLVGTGSKTMKIIKIKSLKVYAYGFYVHPHALCEKLGGKYASATVDELSEHQEFYRDLLREDIEMTVRLVVNCNGMKINSVKSAFEKSLRDRLLKTNPDTDFSCLSTFGSYFQQEIPIPAGTVINFRRTADGRLTTDIGGKQIGAVQSRDLCRAFFGMYIGDSPVSEQTKEDIGTNVANIITRC
uniref:Chalcone isomerase domain-containing protein n=1 Tax=Kalanchoe fedtschenkoi TaxID=63787 RepID=A0A7N0TWN5_KALFE